MPQSPERWAVLEELIPQFASREEYYAIVKPRRTEFLRGLIQEHYPKLIACYGKAFWKDYWELFKGREFKQEGQFHSAVFGDALVICTVTLRLEA